MSDVDKLREELQTKIAELDKTRQEESKRFDKEREERRFLEEADRAERVRVEQEKQAEHVRRKEKEKEEREKKIQEETKEKLERERVQNEQEELNRKLREQYEFIEAEISKAQFAEEQHRKSLEAKSVTAEEPQTGSEVNVENPTAPVNVLKPGEAVAGTEGDTPSTPLLSQHLKHILRQANRNY